MTQWWTYGLSDFLMFSPQAYWRLVARHNEAWWPAQWLGVAAAAGLPVLLRQGAPWASRTALGILALASAWVAWAFHWLRYSEIFLAAGWLAAAWGVQAILLLVAAALPVREPVPARAARLALVLAAAAMVYPLLAPLTGHGWPQAEVFGFMPDPTALATIAVVLALHGQPRWWRWLLAVLPLAALLLAAATRWLVG